MVDGFRSQAFSKQPHSHNLTGHLAESVQALLVVFGHFAKLLLDVVARSCRYSNAFDPVAAHVQATGTFLPEVVPDFLLFTFSRGHVERGRCKLRRSVATRLAKAAKLLRVQDRRLLVWDCYRPSSIQDKLWKLVPDKRYVANPKQGSRHSRGAAVDLGLVDADGNAVTLPTKFDDFSEAAHRVNALEGDAGVEARRLDAAMKKAGFVGIATEWWHFDAPDSAKFPLANEPM
jgi:D-alanyl-D-alanine dipeptidase